MSLTLVQNGKPRRLSEAEIKALTADRVAAWKVKQDAEREKRDSQRNYSERLAFYGVRPRRTWTTLACVGALGVTTGLAWLLTTEAAAALGLTLSLGLMALATWLSTRGQ
jgi:hypothetical protein